MNPFLDADISRMNLHSAKETVETLFSSQMGKMHPDSQRQTLNLLFYKKQPIKQLKYQEKAAFY